MVSEKEKLVFGRWRAQSVALVVAGLVVVGGAGVVIGRMSSTAAPEREPKATQTFAPAPGSGAAASSAPAAGPVEFDLKEDPRFKSGVPLREMDQDIFKALMNPSLERQQLQDLFPDRPYKVRVMGSVTEHRFGQVLIDLDRDGKFEERWEIKEGAVTRMVPTDPASGGGEVRYNLARGRWQPR